MRNRALTAAYIENSLPVRCHRRCRDRREKGSRVAACATAEERAVLAIQQAVHELLGKRCVQLAGYGSE
jgi:hypothetical protein